MDHGNFRLSDADLDFLMNTVDPESREKAKLKSLIQNEEEVRDAFVGDERIFKRIIGDDEFFLRISPRLYFEILLRKTRRQLERADYTIERSGSHAIMVFDTREVRDLMSRQIVLLYLADMLASFTKVESYSISYPAGRGIWRKIRYSDLDIDNIIKYCDWVDEEQRLAVFKRIGDLCLFILGVFPEYVHSTFRYPLSGELRPHLPGWTRRSVQEYEKEGKKFYGLAAEHPAARTGWFSEVFILLHDYFNAAKKPLNFLSEHYLHYRKSDLFGTETSL